MVRSEYKCTSFRNSSLLNRLYWTINAYRIINLYKYYLCEIIGGKREGHRFRETLDPSEI
jgi:hypothetical protein